MNLKYNKYNILIILSIGISFSIAFGILFIVIDVFDHSSNRDLENLSSKKKIFILGSSQVGQLDTKFINEEITKYDSSYIVYNLAIPADNPRLRLNQLEKIISAEPILIVYGAGFRDFGEINSNKFNVNQQFQLPNIQQIFYQIFTLENLTQYDFNNFENPKLATLTILKNSLGTKKCNPCGDSNTPFYPHDVKVFKILKNQTELKKDFIKNGAGVIGFDNNSKNLSSLIKIISKLNDNNINVVIFAPPSPRVFLNPIPNSEIEELDTVLNNLTKNFNVKFINLTDKYADLPIWADHGHVALIPETRIYSDDITKIILEEIRP